MNSGLVLASLALLSGASETETRTLECATLVRAAQTPAEKLKALIERYNKQRSEVLDEYRKTEDEKERGKILARLPGKDYVPEFKAIAEEGQGTDAAAEAWLWVLRLEPGDSKQAWRILQTLLEEHMQSAKMVDVAGELRYGADKYGEANVIEALRAMAAESPLENVQAASLFTLGAVLLESKDTAQVPEGRECLERVIAQYPEAIQRGERTYKAAAEGFLYELDRLQIGMVAPDFQSVDENGVAWKLSDYKGKVVVVDFWGNW